MAIGVPLLDVLHDFVKPELIQLKGLDNLQLGQLTLMSMISEEITNNPQSSSRMCTDSGSSFFFLTQEAHFYPIVAPSSQLSVHDMQQLKKV